MPFDRRSRTVRSRAFGQPEYGRRSIRLAPDLKGPVYKFTLLLPVLKSGRAIFSAADEAALRRLLSEDFGGYTCTEGVTHPLVQGGWRSRRGAVVVDYHTRFEVYARQTPDSIEYFRALAINLASYSQNHIGRRVPGYRGEEQILVELSTVTIL